MGKRAIYNGNIVGRNKAHKAECWAKAAKPKGEKNDVNYNKKPHVTCSWPKPCK